MRYHVGYTGDVMLKIRFISDNPFQIQEARTILAQSKIEVIPINLKIAELQTEDSARLIKDKAIRAFQKIGRPLFVEHTGIYVNYLNQLPGGLTEIFWQKLEADKFTELFGNTADTSLFAKTVIGYIDGKKFYVFEGQIAGSIAKEPRGDRDFQWDCIFVPEGYKKTFAEMGEKKNEISMRKIALDKLSKFLATRGMV